MAEIGRALSSARTACHRKSRLEAVCGTLACPKDPSCILLVIACLGMKTTAILAILAIMEVSSLAAEQTVYIGTRTSMGRSEGVYRMKFDPQTGALRDVKLAAATVDPSFLALHATRPLLFAVVASPQGKVKSFHIEADGDLRLLN